MDNDVGQRPRALVCGDWYNGALIRQELEDRHWEVATTEDVDEADGVLDGDRDFDLLILEWRLPNHCANRTLHHFRAEIGLTDVPVLIVSEGIRIEVEQKLRIYGKVGFMHIPFCGPDFDCFKDWHHHQSLPQRKAA